MSQNKADFLLFTAAFVWGSSYGFMKLGAETMPPVSIAALRCLFAFFILLPFFMKRLRKTDGKILKYSAITGFLIAGVFIGVIYGVIGTSASTAGFLISTSVIMVPILHGLWIQRMPSFPIMLGTAIVTAGLFILNGVTSISLDKGFVLCLLAAFLYALDILFTNTFVSKVDSLLHSRCRQPSSGNAQTAPYPSRMDRHSGAGGLLFRLRLYHPGGGPGIYDSRKSRLHLLPGARVRRHFRLLLPR